MEKSLKKITEGYQRFRKKYAEGDDTLMKELATKGQTPEIMVIACSDSRVDPALVLQCDPGDLFVVRNVANIIPPYEHDDHHHGTSAALEFGICHLNVKHLIILGHSQCGGIHALVNGIAEGQNDFITNWVTQLHFDEKNRPSPDDMAKQALNQSYKNCLSFPWIKQRLDNNELLIHLWFFDIAKAEIEKINHQE